MPEPSGRPGGWEGRGPRVRVAPVVAADLPALRRAIEASLDRLTDWGPTGLDGVDSLVAEQSPARRTFLVHALVADPKASHAIVARVNLNNTVGGRASWTVFGYDAYDPYAGHGLLREGLALLLDRIFARPPEGLGLHRVEAGVQPGNVRSAMLLRSLGFVREGFSRRLLSVPTRGDRFDDWRDHDEFALVAEHWPGSARLDEVAYRPQPVRRMAGVVAGLPAAVASALGRRLAGELGVPYLDSTLTDKDRDAVLADSPVGGLLGGEGADPEELLRVQATLRAAGLDPALVPLVRGSVPEELREAGVAWPGPVLAVDPAVALTDREVARLATEVAADQR